MEEQLQAAVQSMGVSAPLVINEAGSCIFSVPSNDLQVEYRLVERTKPSCINLDVGVTGLLLDIGF